MGVVADLLAVVDEFPQLLPAQVVGDPRGPVLQARFLFDPGKERNHLPVEPRSLGDVQLPAVVKGHLHVAEEGLEVAVVDGEHRAAHGGHGHGGTDLELFPEPQVRNPELHGPVREDDAGVLGPLLFQGDVGGRFQPYRRFVLEFELGPAVGAGADLGPGGNVRPRQGLGPGGLFPGFQFHGSGDVLEKDGIGGENDAG